MSVLDQSPHDTARSQRGAFASRLWQCSLVKTALLIFAGILGTALAIALDPIVNIFAEG